MATELCCGAGSPAVGSPAVGSLVTARPTDAELPDGVALRILIADGVLQGEACSHLTAALGSLIAMRVLPRTAAERMVSDVDLSGLPPASGDESPPNDRPADGN